MSYYTRHIFFCCNQRDNGRECCNDRRASELRSYCKDRVRSLRLAGPGQLRVNQSGCLDRCREGPVAVVYPEAVWYRYHDERDIDEIIDSHLVHGRPVERLRI